MTKANSKEALEILQAQTEEKLASLGYEVVALEQRTLGGQGRSIVLYIDFTSNDEGARKISLEDCLCANKAVDELFENTPLLEGQYSLEVSSPGVERPLRKTQDFARFEGRKARLHTFRPLSVVECENATYWEHHKKQKNFVGTLQGLTPDEKKARLLVDGEVLSVPLELVSKAHLEFVA